ncbi:MAG: FKBP-type peptidyl-prolyl cis-trans isomerase [Bacteroidales bacterium]
MYRLAFFVLLSLLSYHSIPAQQLTCGWDSVCYALGVTWQNDLSRHQIQIAPASFVRGVTACYQHDTTLFSLQTAYDLIEKNEKQLSNENIRSSLLDSLSYAVGFVWAKNIFAVGFPLPDSSILLAGMTSKDESQFNYEKSKKLLAQYLEKIREEEYKGIKLMNENWLAENKNRNGVVALPSGVQYKVLNPPTNERKPSDTSIFVLSYTARLIDGTVFEQSQKPEKFYLSALVPGLHEVLLSMRVGEKREVYIPYSLAFGAGGIKNTVPPFATVIYVIELVDVE